MLLLTIILFTITVTSQTVENTVPSGYTNYRETSTDHCEGSVSICTQELPFNITNPPDVWLDANVSVSMIELNVNNLKARLNLDASVQLKIVDVHAKVQLAVKFDKILQIINRTLESIDLNPLLAQTTKLVENTVNLSVKEISLVVQNLKAHVSLTANVASLVSLNAGVDVSIDTVNLTIRGVKAQVQLAVYLDNIAQIITRTMASLDPNPLLSTVVSGVGQVVNNTLGTLTQNGQLIHQVIDSTGKIVNQAVSNAGEVLSSDVVGDFQQNMTFTGVSRVLEDGTTIKQYTYSPPAGSSQIHDLLVDIIFDASGKVLNTATRNSPSTSTSNTPTTSSITHSRK